MLYSEIDSEENDSTMSSKILNVNILSNTKMKECKKLCSDIIELIEIPRVEEVMLNNVSFLSTLVTSIHGVLNQKNDLDPFAPQLYVPLNQKMIPQIKFYRTFKRKKREGS
ncbi:unnamed protein product [Larinioides sclopetarius]|uniref:Uncharacterized protein n=1 Tax=Larinioides sclopetarius TaxID=280406 RepID=A0AAV2B4F1_9ARAC